MYSGVSGRRHRWRYPRHAYGNCLLYTSSPVAVEIRPLPLSTSETVLTDTPAGTVYNEDGSINVTPVPGDGNTINLLLNKDKSVYRANNQNFKLFLNPYIEIRPFKGMTIQSLSLIHI